MGSTERQHLAKQFRHFARDYFRDSSPLYEVFALTVAATEALLDLASYCRKGQPAPNLLFAAVQDVLLRGVEHPLREFYDAFVETARPSEEAGEPFKDFCQRYRDEIKSLIAVRLVQTNEVRRCVCLQAAFAMVVQTMGDRRLALIELGTSAGLNLCWDQYDYGPDFLTNDSSLKLDTEWRGTKRPPRWMRKPEVCYRGGIDLNLINLEDETARRWLTALIWPEHHERRNRLGKAIEIVRHQKLELRQGDAVECLSQLAKRVPADALLCLYHTWVANQMTEEQKAKLLDVVETMGRSRDLCHIHNNIEDHFHLTYYQSGTRHDVALAHFDGHARWVEWLA